MLALALGSTVEELQNRMSSSEFSEWLAYYCINPFGPERGDLNAGIIAATVANANRSKNSQAYTPKDFMPKFIPEAAETPEQLKNKFLTLAKSLAARPEGN